MKIVLIRYENINDIIFDDKDTSFSGITCGTISISMTSQALKMFKDMLGYEAKITIEVDTKNGTHKKPKETKSK